MDENENKRKRDEITNKLRAYHRTVAEWIQRIWKTSPDETYEQSKVYNTALEYYRNFKSQDGVDYSGIVPYARELHERYDKTDSILDDKADSIIKYLGGGSALITFGALMSIKMENPTSCLLGLVALVLLLPSLVYALFAVNAAVRVRRPQPSAHLPDAKFAVEMAEYHKSREQFDLNLWLIFYPIAEAMHVRNLNKAELVDRAHRFYLWAMRLLILPVVGISICLLICLLVTACQPNK